MNSYYRVRLSLVPQALEAPLTQHAFLYGASGVSEALQFSQPDLTYDPRIVPSKNHELDVFFQNEPSNDFFEGLKKLDFQIQWKVHEEEHKDWLEEWKKGFVPFQLVSPYWIVPSWLPIPEECQHPIRIDPGMAFGTGTHTTTKMASYFIQKISQQYKNEVSDWSLIDVGTGTGILAILAKMAGFGLVTGIEIDPEARRVARENITINQLENEIEISDQLIEEIRGQYDVVVANIIDGVLIQIKDHLLKILSPGGHLFLTGILLERDSLFYEKFIENSPLQVLRRIEDDDWVGYWVKKQ